MRILKSLGLAAAVCLTTGAFVSHALAGDKPAKVEKCDKDGKVCGKDGKDCKPENCKKKDEGKPQG